MTGPRPKILWIPHTAWEHAAAQRPAVLIEKLEHRFEIHIVTWHNRKPTGGSRWGYYLNPVNHLKALGTSTGQAGPWPLHQVSVTLPVYEALTRRYPPDSLRWLSQVFFRRSIRRLHATHHFDAMVCCPSQRLTGYPPAIPGVPRLYDYLDLMPPSVEKHYVTRCERTVCVSHILAESIRNKFGVSSAVIPNGVHMARIRSANPERARAKWNLHGKTVVSLIGLTCSGRYYFLDAMAKLRGEFPNLVFLGAGGGRIADQIQAKANDLGVPCIMTGWVDPSEVADLFAASTIGLYPGDDNTYYDSACPIKVLEYVASRVPVVSNRTGELVHLKLPGVEVRPATADDFAEGLQKVLRNPPQEFADMTAYDWDLLAARFGDEIDAMLSSRAPSTHS